MKMLSNGNVQGKHNNVHTDTNEKTLALEKHRISTTMSTLTQMVAYMKKYWYRKSTRKAPKRALRQNVSYIKKHWHWKNTRKAPK